MPVLFKMSTPSQINWIKNAKKAFLIIKKIKKYHKCPALGNLPSSADVSSRDRPKAEEKIVENKIFRNALDVKNYSFLVLILN